MSICKEHQGGTPYTGHVPIGEWNESHFPVPIVHAQYPEDSLEDLVLDAAKRGESVMAVINSAIEDRIEEVRVDAVAKVISQICDAKNPRLVAHQIAWVSDLTWRQGKTASRLAEKYGLSKQAFSNGATTIAEVLRLKRGLNRRDEEARNKMRLSNKRQTKCKT